MGVAKGWAMRLWATTDGRIAAAMCVVAVGLCALLGIVHSVNQPVYGPIDEVSHAAYVYRVADHYFPPVLGRDTASLRVDKPLIGPHDVRIPREDAVGSAPLPLGAFGEVQQSEAVQPPLYYYAMAPIAKAFAGRDGIIAMRIAGALLFAAAVFLAFLSALELVPERPLAAGLAAVILGTMSGLIDVLSEVQNDVLLAFLSALALVLYLRDMKRQRPGRALAVVVGLAAVTHVIAVPLAALAILAPAWVGTRNVKAGIRVALKPAIIAATPFLLWVAKNLYTYKTLFPHNVVNHTPPNGDLGIISAAPGFLEGATIDIANGAYLLLVASPYSSDQRTLGVLAPLVLLGIAMVARRLDAPVLRALSTGIVIVLVTFLVTFGVLIVNAATAGDATGIFVARYFVAMFVAISVVGGIAIDGIATRPWLNRAIVLAAAVTIAYYAVNSSTITG
jgi:hypothetical protein